MRARHRPRFCGEIEAPRAPVGGVGAALEPAARLHAVDQAGERDRLDLEEVGEADLVDAFVPGELAEEVILSGREPQSLARWSKRLRSRRATYVDQPAEAAVEIDEIHPANIMSMLMMSYAGVREAHAPAASGLTAGSMKYGRGRRRRPVKAADTRVSPFSAAPKMKV